ncbi:MAG: sugar phosphate isomerase/epimerase [Firmicutes bacterium]|nr:sugar phosphate isomerase/epimerase [Bacillota bacterium]
MKEGLTLGASVFFDPELSYRDFCEFVAAHGIRWVEIKLEPVLYYQGVAEEEAAEFLRRFAARVPVSVHALYQELNAGSLNPHVRQVTLEELKRSVEFAAAIGPGTVLTVHPGDSAEAPEELFPAVRENTVEVFRQVLDLARQRGVQLSLENRGQVKRNTYKYGRSFSELTQLRSYLGEDVKYTVDVGHLTFVGQEPEKFVEQLGAKNVALAHIHNNRGIEDEHGATPDGLIDYKAFLEAYYSNNWDFPLVIEVKTMLALLQSLQHLSSLWRQVSRSSRRIRSCTAK